LPAAEIDARVRQAASILGIEAILDRKPRQLSGGQRQRVAVGRAIVRQPQVFLFDEPLSNLDAKLRVQTRREISKLHRELGATMIYVTHDQVEAMTMGDRIVVLNAGRVQQIDTPLGLYRHPVNRFVAGFIGSPAMNFITGTLARSGGLRFVAEDGGIAFPLPDAFAPRLASHDGKRVIAGIRPEDIDVAGDGQPGRATVRVRLDAVEPMGNETFLHARAGAQELTARVAPVQLPEPGKEVDLSLDLAKLHLFDGESEQRITD
jgi:multiple sugar transport system ATP-binding protein